MEGVPIERLARIALLTALVVPALAAGETMQPGAADEGKRLFSSGTTPACAACHALRDANATGAIGPDLDELRPDAERVRSAVAQGFENMPAFGHVLSKAQIDALAQYVERSAGADR